jgi:hypothetical protein
MRSLLCHLALAVCPIVLFGQTEPAGLTPILSRALDTPDSASREVRRYLLGKVPPLPVASSAEGWTAEQKRLRAEILRKYVYDGWPAAWVDGPPQVRDLGIVPGGQGYRMRKLRYEVVPGFWATAILYEPEKMQGKLPAILDPNGHGEPGKAFEYTQKRCINQALRGIVAMNLEWPGMGDLAQPENAHLFFAHLELAGARGLGLFYLTVRKALDFLYDHPNVDRARIGITGLSGGGFQSLLLSALDERVYAAVPVAGFAPMTARIERPTDTGDIEHNESDLLSFLDYPGWVALRAPRPTLLIFNAEDDCCYRGPLLKPYVFDAVKPYFRLYHAEENLSWHLNTDPSTHNYQLDNRQQAYRFFDRWFHLPAQDAEVPVDAQLKTLDELRVGIPPGSLTILGLARKLAAAIPRAPIPAGGAERQAWASAGRIRLADVLRYKSVRIHHASITA